MVIHVHGYIIPCLYTMAIYHYGYLLLWLFTNMAIYHYGYLPLRLFTTLVIYYHGYKFNQLHYPVILKQIYSTAFHCIDKFTQLH